MLGVNHIPTAALVQLVVLTLAVSASSMTITKAKIFKPAREWIMDRNCWLGELFSCPYCTSHWLAFAAVGVYQPRVVTSGSLLFDLFISALIIVALAAVWSGLIYRAFAEMG